MASTEVGYKVNFNAIDIGDEILGYKQSTRRVTDVTVKHNLWSNTPVMDGRYPAILYEHTFRIYLESATRQAFCDFMWELGNSHFYADPKALLLLDVTTPFSQITNYGNCYLMEGSEDTPEELMMFEAGIFTVRFQGITKPTI